MTCTYTRIIRDPNSLSNILAFTTKHIQLNWTVDFSASKIFGSATLSVNRLLPEGTLKLDCSHLNVKRVLDVVENKALKFDVDLKASKFGGLLSVELGSDKPKYDIQIDYETTELCSALQWLTPEQTVGKKHPYLFSQCQAIHARTLLPCQDTPAIKSTFSAIVNCPIPLSVVMSANRRKEIKGSSPDIRTFEFDQIQPIPSYLIAIGAGNIASKEIGPRSAVWSEPEVLEAAAYEFSETETFIKTGEELVGPYIWERYDILLLPPSFPYGGMENPCLTFLTPSLICGDRSLVDVVAHEIAHSWTGNLVSCMNWENFWLNEGFTMFLERKILSRLHGENWRQFNSIIGLADLRESVSQFKGDGPETALIPNLSKTDPDDVFSSVPYEKGYTLLYTLEELVGGGEAFEPFLKAHIERFAGQSIDSEQFRLFILEYFSKNQEVSKKLNEFDWDKWYFGRGMPPTIPKYSEELLNPCRQLAYRWLEPAKAPKDMKEFSSFTPAQRTMFLDILMQSASNLRKEDVEQLDKLYGLCESKNVEILLKWYLLCIRTRTESIYDKAAEFATKHGRMKYCRPILRELFKSGELGRKVAMETFEKNKKFYHPIASQMIAKDLHLIL